MDDQNHVRRELEAVQNRAARLSDQLRKAEAARDRLIERLCDMEGAHDRRFVAGR